MLQSSVVVSTFLFTDIEGSSQLWERDAEQVSVALARHDFLLRKAVESCRGRVVKMSGDGLHAAFDDPLNAVRAALAIQLALADPAATNGLSLRTRCGLHIGTVEHRDNDYFGTAVNRAARIMAAAHGGQILLSQAVVNLVHDRLDARSALRDLGSVRLRDLASPEHVYQLLHPELRQNFPALRSLERTPNNLPRQVTSFVGRQHEMSEARRLLTRTRLLTLVGVAGIGKTRLALQLAADVIDEYSDGVWFADLAQITDPSLVVPVVAQALAVQEQPGRPLAQVLRTHLGPLRLLLILDNCEHVIEACAHLVSSIVQTSAQVRIVATSREALRISGEQTYVLPSLSLPRSVDDAQAIGSSDAVQLFIERARLRRPDFALGERTSPVVAEICNRLDGMPLALELAAAQLELMTVEKIAERLDDRFRLLTGGSRTALPRQQTLRALIDWSYGLLHPLEATLFARLSVLAGGWTLEAAEVVGAGGALTREQVLDPMASLVQKSLVVIDEQDDRYHMLHSIRHYALERLHDLGEESEVRGRMVDHYLSLVETAEPFLRERSEEEAWLHRLDLDYENIKIALAWSLTEHLPGYSALRFCAALINFWGVRGQWREGRKYCADSLAEDVADAPAELRAKVLRTRAVMAFLLGEFDEAQGSFEQALSIGRSIGNRAMEAAALNMLGAIVRGRGDLVAAQTLYQEAILVNREVGNPAWESIMLANLGQVFLAQSNPVGAQEPLERALKLSQELGSRSLEANALSNLGMLARHNGDPATASALITRALGIFQALGAPAREVEQLQLLGEVATSQGERGNGHRLLPGGIGDQPRIGVSRRHRAMLQCAGRAGDNAGRLRAGGDVRGQR